MLVTLASRLFSIFVAVLCVGTCLCCNHYQRDKTDTALPARKASSTWQWATENGDKPGVRLRLILTGQQWGGTFAIVPPQGRLSEQANIVVYTLEDVVQDGVDISFMVRLNSDSGILVKRMRLHSDTPIEGEVGVHIHGQLIDKADGTTPLDVELVRET